MSDNAQRQARRLALDILAPSSAAACAACLDQIDDLVSARIASQPGPPPLTSAARHLDVCVACAESYARVHAARMAEHEQPTHIPAPDLRFLPARPGLAALLAGAVERAADHLRLWLSPELLAALLAQPGPALATRAGGSEQPLAELSLAADAAEQSPALTLTIYPGRAADLCRLRVQVELPDRAWPDLAGVAVEARYAGQERQAATDVWGEVVLNDVPRAALAELQLTVGGSAPETST